MPKIRRPAPNAPRSLAFLASFLALALSDAGARAAVEDPPGRVVLFDGRGLDGWAKTDFLNAGAVKVEDGAIVLTRGRPMTGITSTREGLPRSDYELTYEARRIDGSDFFAAATFPVGDSFLTFVNGGWGGNVTGLSSLDGADASENETNRFVKYENGRWYRFRVHVTAGAVRCWVDEEELFGVDVRGRELRTRIESRRSQPLGFAAYETAGEIRRIELRRLTPEEVRAEAEALERDDP